MAVKYARLFDPVNQFETKSGQLNVAGRLYVHYEGTDDLAALYDENGTQLSQPVTLDNNGRARGLFVDADKVYWLDVQDRYGMSLFTVRKMSPCGGGGGSLAGQVEVISSDGSIVVDKFDDGGTTTFDLSVAEDSGESLDWIRCNGSERIANTNIYRPVFASGTMSLGVQGINLGSSRYYHVTAHVRATKVESEPYYENVVVNVKTKAGNVLTGVLSTTQLVDYSLGLNQEFEVSTDLYTSDDCELLFEIVSAAAYATFSLVDVEVHRVYSGVASSGGGGQGRDGKGIHRLLRFYTNPSQADAEHPEGDWLHDLDALDSSDPSGHPMVTADMVFQWRDEGQLLYLYELDSAGHDYIYAQQKFEDQSEWWSSVSHERGLACRLEFCRVGVYADPYYSTVVAYIRYQDEPYLRLFQLLHDTDKWTGHFQEALTAGENITIDGNVISAVAAQQVQSDWAETDTDSKAYIRNKPNLNQYVTQSQLSNYATRAQVTALSERIAQLSNTYSLHGNTYVEGANKIIHGL